MTTALNARCKILYSILDPDHNVVWHAVAETAADITLARDRQR